ncbi:hypothetical protein B0H19DRAFT_1090290 [Mycena capillaripes]|nr:hypothetical protein B0H19DRAFT_1090290 [Mycena capillaripes]
MSGPFVYSPHCELFPHFPPPQPPPQGYWPGRAYNPSFNSPFAQTGTIYPSSPYSGPIASDDGVPNTPERHLFSGLNGYSDGIWNTPRPRRRRLSWHGGSTPRVSPFIPPPTLPAFLEQTGRRRSWGNTDAPAPPNWYPPAPAPSNWYPPAPPPPIAPAYSAPLYSAPPFSAPLPPYPAPYVSGYPQFPASLHIHPWLNGDVPSPEFVFDLSVTNFTPHRAFSPDHLAPLEVADLQQPAFYPPITKLRIMCDMIPNWPIDLVFGAVGMGMQAPPITLGDVLSAIHHKMHQRITHADWGRLSMSEEASVSRAFTRRCRRESMHPMAQYRSDDELPERQKGVKVVDFLLGRNRFRGLVRSPDGYVKMIVSEE